MNERVNEEKEARARERLAEVRRQLVERPDDPELRAQERRLEDVLAAYGQRSAIRRLARRGRLLLSSFWRRN